MKKLAAGVATAGFLIAAGVGLAATASADPLGGESGQQAVNRLQGQGYVVEVQGDTDAPLSECTATDVSGLMGATKGSTVYVTVSCDDDHDE